MVLLYIPLAAKACLAGEGAVDFCRLIVRRQLDLPSCRAWSTDEETDYRHHHDRADTITGGLPRYRRVLYGGQNLRG